MSDFKVAILNIPGVQGVSLTPGNARVYLLENSETVKAQVTLLAPPDLGLEFIVSGEFVAYAN